MKRFNLLFFCAFIVGSIYSQQANFVYLQTEPAQPFQVKMNGTSYSSSQSGYLILSKLVDTAYQVEVVFPSEKWSSQFFRLSVNQSDRGYLLKDFGDKGWGLMDWRSLLVQYSKKPNETVITSISTVEDTSDFATLLSLAAGDPSLRARSEEKKDTLQKKMIDTPVNAITKVEKVKVDSFQQSVLVETTKVESKNVELVKKDSVQVVKLESSIPDSETITNPRCKNVASNFLVDSLVLTLNTLTSDTKRLLTMSKYFQDQCFSVIQIKQVCSLFKTDEARYDFLLEAWLYVTDRTHFEKLGTVFINQEFVQRFKAMIQ